MLPFTISAWSGAAALAAAIAMVLVLPQVRRSACLLVFLGALGWSTAAIERQVDLRSHFAEPRALRLAGVVQSLPRAREELLEFLFDTRIDAPNKAIPVRFLVRWYRDYRPIRAGDALVLDVRVKPARSVVNFHGHDRETWYFANRISGLATVIREVPSSWTPASLPAIQVSRQLRSERILEVLQDHPAMPTILALAIGDRRFQTREEIDRYRDTGTAHLLAISGLHVGIAASVGYGLGRAALCMLPGGCMLRFGRVLPSLVSFLVATAYAMTTGFPTSARRALIMLACLFTASLLGRQRRPWRIYLLAMGLVLLFDPLSLLTSGFWLSFGAVGVLIMTFAGRTSPGHWLPSLVRAQIGISLAMAPLGMYWFGQWSPGGMLANLIAVPWVSVFVAPPVILANLVPAGERLLSPFLLVLAAENQALLTQALDWFHALISDWIKATRRPSLRDLALATGGLSLMVLPGALRLRGAALVLATLLILEPARKDSQAVVELLDTGQGFAALIRQQDQLVLYDSGPGDGRDRNLVRTVLAPAITESGATPNLLVASHRDLDHAGGEAGLIALFPGLQIIGHGPGQRPCPGTQPWVAGPISFRFLHPSQGLPYLGNDSSCVLSLEINGTRVLFPGDIGAPVEARLVEQGIGNHEILFVPHHGSKSSTSEGFAAAVSAELALVSAAHSNRWGFPVPQVTQRLEGRGARVLSTAGCGAIRINFKSAGEYVVHTARRRNSAPWRWPAAADCP